MLAVLKSSSESRTLIFIAILAERPLSSVISDVRSELSAVHALRVARQYFRAMSLTAPLFTVFARAISWRDLILVLGGVFLLIKATIEIHDRLEAGPHEHADSAAHARFWPVVAQIVVLDAVFSLDSVITAIGMVHDLRHDGSGRYCDDRDARREQAAHQDRKRPSVADYPLFGVPPDGGLCIGCRRLGLSHT